MASATLSHVESSRSESPLDSAGLTVADSVWVGTALLHHARPAQSQFSKQEIIDSVLELSLTNADIKSIKQHVSQHCVANCKPQPNRSRMLYATSHSHRRLFFEGDRYDTAREGSPTHPEWSRLPAKYAFLRDWYATFRLNRQSPPEFDPLLSLVGTGSELWKDEPADQYVANLRSGWGGRP